MCICTHVCVWKGDGVGRMDGRGEKENIQKSKLYFLLEESEEETPVIDTKYNMWFIYETY